MGPPLARRGIVGTFATFAEILPDPAGPCMDAGMRQPGIVPSFMPAELEPTPAVSAVVAPVQVSTVSPGSGRERRQSGGRARARDRLMDRATRSYPQTEPLSQLGGVRGVENLMLFIDDDLRETAMALGNVENYLVEILKLLEAPRIGREEVHALAADTQVLDHVDMLAETLETLRRRLARLSASLR